MFTSKYFSSLNCRAKSMVPSYLYGSRATHILKGRYAPMDLCFTTLSFEPSP